MEAMNRRVSSDRIVGRDEEVRTGRLAIDSLLARDPAHRVPLLLVAGEAGIGKSRLLDELLDDARARGVYAVCGRCLEHGGEIRPLSAISEIVAELVPVAAELGVAIHPELTPLVDVGRDAEPTALSRWPARLDGQFQSLLRDVSARQPVVVAIEDLHWADQTTRALLISLLRARGLDDVLMIGTYRSDELHRRHPLLQFLAEIERTVRCERIDLAPLPDSVISELATAILGEQPSEPTGRDLSRRSGGNPFYVEEILAAGLAGDRLPEGVRHVVLARSQALGTDAIRCVQAASTLAAPVDRLVLRATTELDPASHQAAIDELCRERFLVEDPEGFRFRHDLVREVFLDELLPGERTALFARAAAALERHQPRRLGEIARLHTAGAQLGEALRASMSAASAAEAIGAMAEASESYGRALDIWHRVDRPAELASCSHLELLRRAARAADLSRDFDSAVELGRLAAAAAADGDPIVEGATLFELAQYTWNASAPGLDEVIDRALQVLPPEPPSVERARMEIRRANRLRLRGENEEAAVLLRRAADTARALGDRGVEADARSTLGYDRAVFGDEAALAEIYEALALADRRRRGRGRHQDHRQPLQHPRLHGPLRRGGPTGHRRREHRRTLRVDGVARDPAAGQRIGGAGAVGSVGRGSDDRRRHRSPVWRRQRAPMGIGARRLGADRDPSGWLRQGGAAVPARVRAALVRLLLGRPRPARRWSDRARRGGSGSTGDDRSRRLVVRGAPCRRSIVGGAPGGSRREASRAAADLGRPPARRRHRRRLDRSRPSIGRRRVPTRACRPGRVARAGPGRAWCRTRRSLARGVVAPGVAPGTSSDARTSRRRPAIARPMPR